MDMRNIKKSTLFIFYGVLCLLTAMILSIDTKKIPPANIFVSGGEYGPITTTSNNSVVDIGLEHRLPTGTWNAIEVAVLDENKNYLFSFADEVWHEVGHDSDGRWEEDVSKFNMEITFPKAGNYYLALTTENPAIDQNSIVTVRSSVELGSNILFLWFGWITLIIGIVWKYYE